MSTYRPYCTPEEYEKLVMEWVKNYRSLYAEYLIYLEKPCDCDRSSCANCLTTDSTRCQLNDMVTRGGR